MDKLTHYSDLIGQVLNEYVNRLPKNSSFEPIVIQDVKQGHYQLLFLRWRGKVRELYIYVHVRLINDKIWIEEDNTEDGIATELVTMGVPRDDIVLAFYTPEERRYTEFAVA